MFLGPVIEEASTSFCFSEKKTKKLEAPPDRVAFFKLTKATKITLCTKSRETHSGATSEGFLENISRGVFRWL
jgi:hypothetical protein